MRTEQIGPKRRRRLAWLIPVGALAVVLAAALILASQNPSIAAHGADLLRAVIGDKAVASLETALFEFEDAIQRWEFRLGLVTPTVPWTEPTSAPTAPLPTASATLAQTPEATLAATLVVAPQTPTETPTPSPWQPASVEPMGSLPDEGIWSAWIQDASGRTV